MEIFVQRKNLGEIIMEGMIVIYVVLFIILLSTMDNSDY